MSKIHAIITDIEGTTSSISFVKDVLFPYAYKQLPDFVATHGDCPQVKHWLLEAAKESGSIDASRPEIVMTLRRWIEEDRKSTALKALQGMIWQEGYTAGYYRTHIYPDVAAQLRAWHDAGVDLYVYSSGSVLAQKLLFGHTDAGDLTPLFSGYFDTEIGAKRAQSSYARIAAAIDQLPEHLLFLSDSVDELDAAGRAGLQTGHLIRSRQVPSSPLGTHPVYINFDAITLP